MFEKGCQHRAEHLGPLLSWEAQRSEWAGEGLTQEEPGEELILPIWSYRTPAKCCSLLLGAWLSVLCHSA